MRIKLRTINRFLGFFGLVLIVEMTPDLSKWTVLERSTGRNYRRRP